jgi:hypothetical protein
VQLIAIPSAINRPYRPAAEQGSDYNDKINPESDPCDQWTILLLAPLDFFRFSDQTLSPSGSFQERVAFRSMEGATLCVLERTYKRLLYNWRLFKTHFDNLLDEGDTLFHPELHDRLLWEDDTFSRVRKYAWAIDCLTEFERSIKDNIHQWKGYRSARFDHLLKAGKLSFDSRNCVEKIERVCDELGGLHQYFSDKLASTNALRDAVSVFIPHITIY